MSTLQTASHILIGFALGTLIWTLIWQKCFKALAKELQENDRRLSPPAPPESDEV